MSGSSRSTFDDSPSYADACDQLTFTAQLASPKEDIVAQLKVDDRLDVAFGEQHGQAVVQVLWNGQVAGGIAAQQVQRLRQCLTGGTMYSARVLSINNGQVRVSVFPVRIS